MNVGDIITVYEDPDTELTPEGQAVVKKRSARDLDGIRRVEVCFIGDDPDMVVSRLVKG